MNLVLVIIVISVVLYFLGNRKGLLNNQSLAKKEGQRKVPSVSSTPISHVLGEAFEDYLERWTFSHSDFTLLYRTASYSMTQQKYDPKVKMPDFKFRCRIKTKEFWVEAKHRGSTVEGKVEWCNWEQLQRYRRVDSKEPVFVAIGLGGKPTKPHRLFIVPLSALKYTGVYLKVLEPFEVNPNAVLRSHEVWGMLGRG